MAEELILSFPDKDHVIVDYNRERTKPAAFATPITDADREDIRWYLEVYASKYTQEPDDDRAYRIEAKSKTWGEALVDAAFAGRRAGRLFSDFYDACIGGDGGLLTIDSAIPKVLSLPWELLCVEGRHLSTGWSSRQASIDF